MNNSRVVSALIMLPLLIFVALGGVPLVLASLIISGLAMFEFIKGCELLDIRPSLYVSGSLLLVLHILAWEGFRSSVPNDFFYKLITMWVALVMAAGFFLILTDRDRDVRKGLSTQFVLLYIGFSCIHLVMLDNLPENRNMIWIAVITAVITDIFAYLGGSMFGVHKLAPSISSKKTVEGALCGIAASAVVSLVFGLIFVKGHAVGCLVAGLLGSCAAQAGDLVASAFKRKMGIKDYSNLIPGHGGVLDRFDSHLFTYPFIYYFTLLFINKGI